MTVAPSGDGHKEVAHRAQSRLGGVQEALGDGADLGGCFGRGEGGEVRCRTRHRERLGGERVPGEERLGVPACPAQQVVTDGDAEAGGGDLLGVAADVVVQLEVGVLQGKSPKWWGMVWASVRRQAQPSGSGCFAAPGISGCGRER